MKNYQEWQPQDGFKIRINTVFKDYSVREELLKLIPMHASTRGEEILNEQSLVLME